MYSIIYIAGVRACAVLSEAAAAASCYVLHSSITLRLHALHSHAGGGKAALGERGKGLCHDPAEPATPEI